MTSASEARQALIDLNTLSRRDLFALWQQISGLPAEEIRDALIDLLPLLADTYGSAAATLAADWYDDLREAQAVRGRFTAEPATLPTQGRYEALARWAVEPLFGAEPDVAAALSKVDGGMQRIVSDAHRLTIVESTQRDPQARGWQRVGVGGSCGFCRMLIGRGGVYTESSVTFRSHDHCNCAASPVWDDRVVRISPEAERQSSRNRSAATKAKDNKRAYTYIAEHYGD